MRTIRRCIVMRWCVCFGEAHLEIEARGLVKSKQSKQVGRWHVPSMSKSKSPARFLSSHGKLARYVSLCRIFAVFFIIEISYVLCYRDFWVSTTSVLEKQAPQQEMLESCSYTPHNRLFYISTCYYIFNMRYHSNLSLGHPGPALYISWNHTGNAVAMNQFVVATCNKPHLCCGVHIQLLQNGTTSTRSFDAHRDLSLDSCGESYAVCGS